MLAHQEFSDRLAGTLSSGITPETLSEQAEVYLRQNPEVLNAIWTRSDGTLAWAAPGFKDGPTLTRERPAGWKGYARRIDRDMVREVAWPKEQSPLVFVCGPTSFVESASGLLVDFGYDPSWIKTERFGATGG